MFNIDTLTQAMEAGAKEYLQTQFEQRTLVGAASRLFSFHDHVSQPRAEKSIQYLSQAHTREERLLVAYAILNNSQGPTLRSYLIDAIENSTAITDKAAYQEACKREMIPSKHPVDYTLHQPELIHEDAWQAKATVLTRWLSNQFSIDPQHVNNITADLNDGESNKADLSLMRSSPTLR